MKKKSKAEMDEIQRKRIKTLKKRKAAKKAALEKANAAKEEGQKIRDEVLNCDLFQKRIENLKLWQTCHDIVVAILEQFKSKPTEISASLLNVCMRNLSSSDEALKQLDQLQREYQDLSERDTDGMTESERQMLADFNKLNMGVGANEFR